MYVSKGCSWKFAMVPVDFLYMKHALILTVVNTLEAVVQERQGTRGMGLGQFVTARDAICRGKVKPCQWMKQKAKVRQSYIHCATANIIYLAKSGQPSATFKFHNTITTMAVVESLRPLLYRPLAEVRSRTFKPHGRQSNLHLQHLYTRQCGPLNYTHYGWTWTTLIFTPQLGWMSHCDVFYGMWNQHFSIHNYEIVPLFQPYYACEQMC